jgi:hypothetical protein
MGDFYRSCKYKPLLFRLNFAINFPFCYTPSLFFASPSCERYSNMAKDGIPDNRRTYVLYRYLLHCLAISRKADGAPNAARTASRVGDNELRKLIPQLQKTEQEWVNAIGSSQKVGKITTGRLVEMLAQLRQNLSTDYKEDHEHYSRVLSPEDILLALYQLIELTPTERKQLGLQDGDGLTLLKQTLLKLQISGGTENYETILQKYKAAIGLNSLTLIEGSKLETLEQIDVYIEKTVRSSLSYLPQRENRYTLSRKDPVFDLSRKAQREIRRLLALSGNTQTFLPDAATKHSYIQRHLQPLFIKKLVQTLVNNERLTDQFPVYLNRLTMKPCGPLPFADTNLGTYESSKSYPPLLNEELQRLDGKVVYVLGHQIPGPSDYELASQGAIKMTLEFYIKVPETYKSKIPEIFESLAATSTLTDNSRRVDFTVSSTGIGGTLSHAIKVINITLLSDIVCLNSFFPIAHDVIATEDIVSDNVSSPVWAHSLVKLRHKETVREALLSFHGNASSYDEFSFGDPIGHGDFCGFDFILAQVRASLQSRLQAIRNASVNPQDYIEQLCEKVERQLTLERARQRLTGYPFSSMAMIGVIYRDIIGEIVHEAELPANSLYIYFSAYLAITEVLLNEGAYLSAAVYLKKMKALDDYAQQELPGDGNVSEEHTFTIFSGTLIVRYLLCQATYYYLFDEQDSNRSHLLPKFQSGVSRQQLVEEAWKILKLAQVHIETRLKKYLVVDEVSQGTFHPHYEMLGRLYFIRAKLLIFFPHFVPKDTATLPTEKFIGQRTPASVHWGRLYLIEKARLYVAADGNSTDYAIFSAIQSCLYLVAAYENPQDLVLGDRTLTREICLKWAKTLRNHALITYADTGRQCYYDIKEKSGLSMKYDDYGKYRIETIPAIFESRYTGEKYTQAKIDGLVALDISLLSVDIRDLPKLTPNHPTENIYLFGVNACYLFFARGLFLLCNDMTDEAFERQLVDEPSRSTIQWKAKLNKALRLLDMAWAIAEDGCEIKKERKTDRRMISRTFCTSDPENQYTSDEIDSVRDLYPCRVSEIADLGKIFSAACMVLYLHTLPSVQRATTQQNIEKIFSMLHGEYKLKNSLTRRGLLSKQKRYNSHLREPLGRAQDILLQYVPNSNTPASPEAIESCRNQLMNALFAAFLG